MGIERWFRRLAMRLRALASGGRLDRELDEELQYHIDRQVEANVARGLSASAARREALLALGGLEPRKEDCRDARRVRLVQDALQDLRYAVRTLRRAPAFTTAAVLTLALGIGATAAMFTVVNGVLLRPMPFPRPEQLFLISWAPQGPFMRQPGMSDRDYLTYRTRGTAFQHLAAFTTQKANLTGDGDPAVVTVGSVTSEFFSALGVPPAAGRTFSIEDERRGLNQIVVLGEPLWRARFGSDPAIVGKAMTLDGVSHTIIGIMPASFNLPSDAQAWTPKIIRLDPGNSFLFPVLGRLKPDVTVAQARAQFDALMLGRSDEWRPNGEDRWIIGILPLKDLLVGDIRGSLQIFAGAVMFVLLIACANVANLLLARASGRQREIAVRAALGASRARLIRQLLTESTIVAVAGGVCGLLAARWAVPVLLSIAPKGRIPRLEMIVIDGRVLTFVMCVSVLTGIVFGLAPALRLTRRRFAGSLLPGGRTLPSGQERLRAALVVGEIALALVLLTGAGLMLRSFARLRAVDPGFRTENVVTLAVNLARSKYAASPQLQAFHRDTLTRLSALPDVVAAGLVNWRPLGDMHLSGDFQIEGVTPPPTFNVDKPAVSAGYFRAMGIRVLRGREFDDRDDAGAARVAIVSRSVARAISPSEDALGRRVTLRSQPTSQDWLTVVGVVDDVKQLGPALGAHPAIYQPYQQVQQQFFLSHMNFVVRTATDPLRVLPSIRVALRAVDKDQPTTSVALMDDVLGAATAEPGFQVRLLGAFAALAVLLALVGTYGVLAYTVSLRTQEIGLRMALGARTSAVLWMVIRRTLILGAAGIVLGTAGALLATRLLATVLFEITPTDPPTFVAVIGAILTAALIAGLIPARRATRVDPLVALRHD